MNPPEPKPVSRRFEWVSLIYLGLFLLAVMTPSIVTHPIWGLSQPRIEEILIFLFGAAGLATFSIYERLMEHRMRERDAAVESAERVMKELVESYRYIGSVNRQLEVLKKHMNQTSLQLVGRRAYWKDLLQSLTANAAAAAAAPTAVLRFVELDRLRTDREIYHRLDGKTQIKIANRELKRLHDEHASHATLVAENGDAILAIPSDNEHGSIKAFLLLAIPPDSGGQTEISLLKVFANQAELIYHQLIAKPEDPAAAIEAVTQSAKGNVR